ncbi:MAG TPA: endonuclease/exonuclease/phosphatase family protein [Micromonosporaceae bacterium]|nr:endonuclease/exonuclease/phosphatase family protein [Micromonosporaceae bacterium]
MATMTAARTVPGGETGRRTSRAGRVLAIVAIVTALVIAGHGLVPDVRGLGSLVDTAAPWLGLAIPVLALGALIARSKLAAVAIVLPLVVWLVAFGSAWLQSGGGSPDLRVANQNVDADNANPAATMRSVAETHADVVGLEEVTASSAPVIASTLGNAYPYHVQESTVQLWSRYPISDFSGVDLGLSWTRALRAQVATPKGAVTVYVVHLASARAGQTATRDSTMDALVDRIRTDSSPRIVLLGDLNTASTDRVLTPLAHLLRDTQPAAGRGLGFTWPSAFPLTRPDHIMTRGLTATQSSVVDTSGSDHRAIISGLRL